jgi:hypothetical protein
MSALAELNANKNIVLKNKARNTGPPTNYILTTIEETNFYVVRGGHPQGKIIRRNVIVHRLLMSQPPRI